MVLTVASNYLFVSLYIATGINVMLPRNSKFRAYLKYAYWLSLTSYKKDKFEVTTTGNTLAADGGVPRKVKREVNLSSTQKSGLPFVKDNASRKSREIIQDTNSSKKTRRSK